MTSLSRRSRTETQASLASPHKCARSGEWEPTMRVRLAKGKQNEPVRSAISFQKVTAKTKPSVDILSPVRHLCS